MRGKPAEARSAVVKTSPGVWQWVDRYLGRGSYPWLRRHLDPQREYTQRIYARRVIELLQPGVCWLDAGCGHRVFPALGEGEERGLLRGVRLVVGCDASLTALRRHRSLQRLVCSRLDRLPFRDASFDLITLNMVMEHLIEPQVVLAEFVRVLSPQGRLVVHTPNSASYYVWLIRLGRRLIPERLTHRLIEYLESRRPEDVFPTFYRANTRNRLSKVMQSAGLGKEEMHLLADRPFFYFIAPLSALEILFGRLLRALGGDEYGCDTVLAVCRRAGSAPVRRPAASTGRGVAVQERKIPAGVGVSG